MRDDEVPIVRPCPVDIAGSVARAIEREQPSFHCGHCDRGVLVLSAMRESEATEALAQHGGDELCVAYLRNARGRLRFRPESTLIPATRLRPRRTLRSSALAMSLAACTPHGAERLDPVELQASEVAEPCVPPTLDPFTHEVPVDEVDDFISGGMVALPIEKPPKPEPLGTFVVGAMPPPKLRPPPAPKSPLPPIAIRPATPPRSIERSLEQLMPRAIYTPDPSARQLQMTRAARFERSKGQSVTRFSIDRDGRVFDVETKQPFPEDPQVDAIIRKTIRSWRFLPLESGEGPDVIHTEHRLSLDFG